MTEKPAQFIQSKLLSKENDHDQSIIISDARSVSAFGPIRAETERVVGAEPKKPPPIIPQVP